MTNLQDRLAALLRDRDAVLAAILASPAGQQLAALNGAIGLCEELLREAGPPAGAVGDAGEWRGVLD